MTFISRNRSLIGTYAICAVALTMLVLMIIGIAHSTAGVPVDRVAMQKAMSEDAGGFGPMLGLNGKVSMGTDLGGFGISPSGKVSILAP